MLNNIHQYYGKFSSKKKKLYEIPNVRKKSRKNSKKKYNLIVLEERRTTTTSPR